MPDLDGRGGRKECVAAEVGPPGTIWWAPAGAASDMFSMRTARTSALWRSAEGRDLQARYEIAHSRRHLPHFGRGWNTGGLFYPLLGSDVNRTVGPPRLVRFCLLPLSARRRPSRVTQ